jgi:hypothetical protein
MGVAVSTYEAFLTFEIASLQGMFITQKFLNFQQNAQIAFLSVMFCVLVFQLEKGRHSLKGDVEMERRVNQRLKHST